MKKTILLLALLATAATNLNAQLNVTSTYDDSKTAEMTLIPTETWIQYNPMFGYSIMARTDNRFDKYALFRLGKTKEAAKQTIDDLYSLLETNDPGFTATVTDHNGNQHVLFITDAYLSKQISVKSKGCAGYWRIRKKDLEHSKFFITTTSAQQDTSKQNITQTSLK
jgi:hypothetical protein